MTTYHVTVDAPMVYFVVEAADRDEALEIVAQLADRTTMTVLVDGQDDDRVGFCDGPCDHGPFDFGEVYVYEQED